MMTTRQSALHAGTKLGPYRITDILAHGGMGVVYRASHLVSGEVVAIKTVHLRSTALLAAIRREILALTHLKHPCIAEIRDLGFSQGIPWYAMELLEGDTLKVALQASQRQRGYGEFDTSLPDDIVDKYGFGGHGSSDDSRTITLVSAPAEDASPRESDEVSRLLFLQQRPAAPTQTWQQGQLLDYLADLCETLAHVHANGFVHRDLKPANIFLRGDGRCVLVDFGISCRFPAALSREDVDVSDRQWGTAFYMAPEQIRGDLIDARADLYAIGCILYECLVGRPPFVGTDRWQILSQHLHTMPAPIVDLPSHSSHAWNRLIGQLLEKQPLRRLAYAEIVARMLRQLNRGVDPFSLHFEFPPIYLFRPTYVPPQGFDQLERALRHSLKQRSRASFLVEAPVGGGKTRALLELAGRLKDMGWQIIYPGSAASTELTNSSFLVFRPILTALYEYCQGLDPERQRELLAPHVAYLSKIWPDFSTFIDLQAPSSVVALNPAVERQWVMDALVHAILAFARMRPLVLFADDLQWADALSLEALDRLIHTTRSDCSLVIVGATRPIAESSALQRWTQSEDIALFKLGLLDHDMMRALVSDMLAAQGDVPAELVEETWQQSHGNPLIATEFLLSLTAESSLVFRGVQGWTYDPNHSTVSDGASNSPNLSDAAQRDLLRRRFRLRLRKLGPLALQITRLVAVAGGTLAADGLRRVLDRSESDFAAALHELHAAQVFDPQRVSTPGFIHGELACFVAETLPQDELWHLHRTVANYLEGQLDEQNQREASAKIARHYSAAQEHRLAFTYWILAARSTENTWAHPFAIDFYACALKEIALLDERGEAHDCDRTAVLEAKADAEYIAGSPHESIESLKAAQALVAATDLITRARIVRKIARGHTLIKEHAQAATCFERILEFLADTCDKASEAWKTEWIDVVSDRAWSYYWQGQLAALEDLLQSERSFCDSFGSTAQRAKLASAELIARLRSKRYQLDSNDVELALQAFAIAEQALQQQVYNEAIFCLGFAELFAGQAPTAVLRLDAASDACFRSGDSMGYVRCLAYIATAQRLLGKIEQCEATVDKLLAQSAVQGMRDYHALALANRGWLAWQRHADAQCLRDCEQALQEWQRPPASFPFLWLAVVPMCRVLLKQGAIGQCLEMLGLVAKASQQRRSDAFLQALLDAQHLAPDQAACVVTRVLQVEFPELEQQVN